MMNISMFLIIQAIGLLTTIIYYVLVFRKSEQAKTDRDEKKKVDLYNKTVTGTWEEGKEPYISYKTTKN